MKTNLKTSARFWSALISGGAMVILIEVMIGIKLLNPFYRPSPVLIACVWILFVLFLYCGFKKDKPSQK